MKPNFFGKRSEEPITIRPTHNQPGAIPNSGMAARDSTAHTSAHASSTPAAAPAAMATTTTLVPASSTEATAYAGPPVKEGGSKLTVGPNIKLKGVEITDCDTLVVEGTVEATMDSRVIHITANGAFKGSAEIDYAEIHGAFDGDLTVREKLVIYSTGRVSGKIRYGKVVIQEGGQLKGDIQFGAANDAKALPPPKANVLNAA